MAFTRRISIASEYEETREQRIKLNRERFQKLGIVDLSLQLKPKHTPIPYKPRIIPSDQPRRRSSRLQNPPVALKRSRDTVLEGGVKPEYYTQKHDGLAVTSTAKIEMPAEDPDKPKRPPYAFIVFL
ncbi:hypothetical protein KSS87_005717 [Heliosperma pusillum]|nr:hypothetical protein KSS87_005717 [Heliosperma pusillum]